MTTCPWCRTPFDNCKIGAHVKTFCSASCRHQYQKASRKLGEVMAATMQPGALLDWMTNYSSRAMRGSASRASDEAEAA